MQLENEQMRLLDGLPGGELVSNGIEQIAEGGFYSVESLLVFLAIPRMSASGFPELAKWEKDAPKEIEHELYRALSSAPDPYGEYNALKNRLASFLSALDARWRRLSPVTRDP